MLERLKTLAIQSANGTYTTLARENIDAERIQLMDEIDRIGQTSDFDEIPLFDSSQEPPDGKSLFEPPERKDEITLQIGASSAETLDVPRYYMSAKALNLHEITLTTLPMANEAVTKIDEAIEAVADIRADFGAAYNHLEHTHNNLSVTSENMTAAESQIRDTNMAEIFTEYAKDNIVYQSSSSMVAQANTIPELVLRLLQ